MRLAGLRFTCKAESLPRFPSWPLQRRRRPTSSATRSWTSKGRRKATAGRTRTPGSSVTNSECGLPGPSTPPPWLCCVWPLLASSSVRDVHCGYLLCSNISPAPRLGELQGGLTSFSVARHSASLDCRYAAVAELTPTALKLRLWLLSLLSGAHVLIDGDTDLGYVEDWTACGTDHICFNHKCLPMQQFNFSTCPGSTDKTICSGHGVRTHTHVWANNNNTWAVLEPWCWVCVCRCAATSWSVCATWAGQETTVTPHPRAATWWWDPPPRFQVEAQTLHLSACPPSFIRPSLLLAPFTVNSCRERTRFVFALADLSFLWDPLRFYSLNHACLLFFFSLFSHPFFGRLMSLMEWLEVRFEFLFIVFVCFPAPLFHPNFSSSQSVSSVYYCSAFLNESPLLLSELGWRCGSSVFTPTSFLPSSPWAPLLLNAVSCRRLFVACEFPPVRVIDETRDAHLFNTLSAPLSSSSVSGITVTNIIIGSIVGSILFLVLILAVTAWCYKWVSAPSTLKNMTAFRILPFFFWLMGLLLAFAGATNRGVTSSLKFTEDSAGLLTFTHLICSGSRWEWRRVIAKFWVSNQRHTTNHP